MTLPYGTMGDWHIQNLPTKPPYGTTSKKQAAYPTSNTFVLQFLADLLGKPVVSGDTGRLSYQPGPNRLKVNAWYEGWKKAL